MLSNISMTGGVKILVSRALGGGGGEPERRCSWLFRVERADFPHLLSLGR